jgi:hypothetical protein
VTLRGPEASQRATFLELFFDLALVFALFQVSRVLVQHLHWSDALRALVLLVALWRIWFITTWVTDRLDQQWWALQLRLTVLSCRRYGCARRRWSTSAPARWRTLRPPHPHGVLACLAWRHAPALLRISPNVQW